MKSGNLPFVCITAMFSLVAAFVGRTPTAYAAALSEATRRELSEARTICAELGEIVPRLEAERKGQYSRMQYEVIRYSLDAIEKHELPRGRTNRVVREVRELMSFAPQALARARRVVAGEECDLAVPRFKLGPIRSRGPILFGSREWPDGRDERDKPVMLKDGAIRAYMRVVNSGSHCAWQSESKDGGRTWSKSGPCDFMQTSSRRFVRRLKSGALLLVKNGPLDKDVGRNDMTAYISDDDGSTWKGGLLLHKGACSYPDGDQADDGSIYVIYDTERTGNRVNSLARFTEDDVRAGKIVSASSNLDLKVDVRK